MGQKEKLIKRLKSVPKNFTFEEAESLLGYFSYYRDNKGKTSGSRVMFSSSIHNTKILLHKPPIEARRVKENRGVIQQLLFERVFRCVE